MYKIFQKNKKEAPMVAHDYQFTIADVYGRGVKIDFVLYRFLEDGQVKKSTDSIYFIKGGSISITNGDEKHKAELDRYILKDQNAKGGE